MALRRGLFLTLIGFFLVFCVFSQSTVPESSVVAFPDSIRRPQSDEYPRYPNDMIIGELVRGTAPVEAWVLSRDFLNALVRANKSAEALNGVDSVLLEQLFEEVSAINPGNYRIGGGRVEPDGAVSFLVRFIGREKSITGELYLVSQETEEGLKPWRIDDLQLEESYNLADLIEARRYDFSFYERLY